MENLTFEYIEETAPDFIKMLLDGLKHHKENPQYHPEGNAYDHIKIVVNRLIKTGDPDLIMAGFFHDLGKLETASPSEEGDFNTSYGHENISTDWVMKYKDWIQEMGANPYHVKDIVSNHMKIKFSQIPKKHKKQLEKFGIYPKIERFTQADSMNRKWDLDESRFKFNLKRKGITSDYVIGDVVISNIEGRGVTKGMEYEVVDIKKYPSLDFIVIIDDKGKEHLWTPYSMKEMFTLKQRQIQKDDLESEMEEQFGDDMGGGQSSNVPKWESGMNRGKANPIDDKSKWESGMGRGHANSLF